MNYRYIDIHAHVNTRDFDADRGEVVKRAQESGTAMINVGTDKDVSKSAVDLALKYDSGVYAIVGLHPVHTHERFDAEIYKQLAMNPKVVGIGECGLDYFRLDESTKSIQKEDFIKQIELANECKKPLMLHLRDAYDDALDILKSHAKVRGDVHFFAGTQEHARNFLDLGFTISFTGVVTFAKQYADLVSFVPLDMIQAETDCPYVAPVPFRGKRNEPLYVKYVVEKIADIKKQRVEVVSQALLSNAQRLFGLDLGVV